MKKNIISKIALLFVTILTISSCVDNNDYSLPTVTEQDPGLTATNTIQSVKDMYNGSVVDFKTLGNEGLMIIEGYVVSSDESGNIYKTISIQDSPENPTAAIQLAVDAVGTYASYEVGRKVYVKLHDPNSKFFNSNKLGLHDNNGVLEIGQLNGTEVNRISSTDYQNVIIRSTETATIVPVELPSIANINESHISMLIQLNEMQALNKGETYANLDDTYNVNRYFKSCFDEETIIMRNSGFADFKAQSIPEKRGAITAVLGNYRGDYQLFIRSTDDVNFTTDRCDPVYEENFQSAVDNTDLDINGWINYAESGSTVWTEQVYKGNGYAEFNPYRSGDTSNIGWLITPSIDLDAQDGEVLTFQTEHAYPDAGHEPLEVFISTDFNGTEAGVTTATWTPLTFKVSYIEDYGSWFTYTNSGEIDLSSYSGTAYIAFKYTGSDTANQNMTLHIDNVKVSVK